MTITKKFLLGQGHLSISEKGMRVRNKAGRETVAFLMKQLLSIWLFISHTPKLFDPFPPPPTSIKSQIT